MKQEVQDIEIKIRDSWTLKKKRVYERKIIPKFGNYKISYLHPLMTTD